jgi:hypothetical protein
MLLVLPWILFSTQIQEHSFNGVLLFPFIVLFVLCVIVLYGTLRCISQQRRTSWSHALFYLGVYCILEPYIIAPFAASQLFSHGFILKALSLMGCILFFFIVQGAFFKSIHRILGGPFTLLFFITSLYSLPALYSTIRFSQPKNTAVSSPTQAIAPSEKKSTLPNIYHIVFDTYGNDFFKGYLKEYPALANELDGVTYFARSRSNFINTIGSTHSFLTGTLPLEQGIDIRAWLAAPYNEALFSQFASAGYEVNQYVPTSAFNPSKDTQEIALPDNELRSAFTAQFVRVADMVLFRLFPHFLKDMVTPRGENGVVAEWFLAARWLRYPPSHELSYLSVPVLNNFLEQEKQRSPTGRYSYMHLMLPHGPASWTKDCESIFEPGVIKKHLQSDDPLMRATGRGYTAIQIYSDEAMFSSHHCATKYIYNIIRHLKDLNRYDQSIILIHSDHGTPQHFFTPYYQIQSEVTSIEDYEMLRNSNDRKEMPETLDLQSRALLLFKPAHARHPFQVSDQHAQLVDIANTLYSLVGITHREPHGIALFEQQSLLKDRWLSLLVGLNTPDEFGKIKLLDPKRVNKRLNHFGYNPTTQRWIFKEHVAFRQ